MPGPPRKILMYVPSAFGGIGEHAHYQAQELARRGWLVTMLCHRGFLRRDHDPLYRQRRVLLTVSGNSFPAKILRKLATIADPFILAFWIVRLRSRLVLTDALTEYSAALWIWPHLLLRLMGVTYLTNFHDPVREAHGGTKWWHRLCLALTYRLYDGGLIHGPVPAEAHIPPRITLIDAPLGYFDDLRTLPVIRDIRGEVGIARDRQLVLSFGHIADRKNLDLLIEAVANAPGWALLVAGPWSSATQRGPGFYRELAKRLGCADRVHIRAEFIADADVPSYFAACDIVALTYRGDFVSQSGVLQHAAAFRKPVLVSCGPGPLRQTLERFPLGVLVEPDSVSEIVRGLNALEKPEPIPDLVYRTYDEAASWRTNIDRLEVLNAKVAARKLAKEPQL